eukprot:CAMPEP_0197686610 /NCGR_PEP_ID=MMETSP1338-20131121/102743_1 /TAXON_ID=43686 ORGANISM="Pelagodinium beii, Strain RCC1491" /NCGR_SAMPLE_ID=MMETSP1338 /ASSEMBLY_ACC=CAM_ASM_000754 /LENGTH=56 /DNA_ID=CAMNT_0043268567 /DNA_START=89 /DNA_END=260 /DNA_ORIENTATION=-
MKIHPKMRGRKVMKSMGPPRLNSTLKRMRDNTSSTKAAVMTVDQMASAEHLIREGA